ncbi:MAG: hypothetical protein ACXIU8_09290 [Alkalilacustris sp.]
MTVVATAYLVFGVLAGLAFRALPVRRAILLVFLGGWVVLPVGVYPDTIDGVAFAWWITGAAVPSDMLLTKAWVAPVTALVWAVVVDGRAVLRWRPCVVDLPLAVWCLAPIAGGLTSGDPDPHPLVASAYLLGAWGAVWILGRVWFADAAGRVCLLKGLALAGLACLPFALLEGTTAPWLHTAAFDAHPFQLIGHDRPFGARPLGFFEDGNQYALWVALSAVAAVWVAISGASGGRPALWACVAVVVVAMAAATQGRGALLLSVLALVILVGWQVRLVLGLGGVVVGLAALAAAVHVSGLVPVYQIVRGTEVGRHLLTGLRDLGLGSFAWRIGQDARALELVMEAPWTGAGRWDWSHPSGTRPWGLWLLAAGQFGVPAVAAASVALAAPALARLRGWRGRMVRRAEAAAVPLALIVLAAMADAWLNAWLFFPAIMAAGALARAVPADLPWNDRSAPHRPG